MQEQLYCLWTHWKCVYQVVTSQEPGSADRCRPGRDDPHRHRVSRQRQLGRLS